MQTRPDRTVRSRYRCYSAIARSLETVLKEDRIKNISKPHFIGYVFEYVLHVYVLQQIFFSVVQMTRTAQEH